MTHLASAQPDGARRFPAPALALDFGGTSMRAALVLPDGSLHGRRRADTPRSDAAAFAEACRELLSRTLDGAAESPVALAISAPGPLDPRAGVLVDPPNLPQGLWNYPIAETLGAAVSLPAHLERDTLVAALGEGAFGAARGVADYVYLTVSTGLGGAVVSDGRLLRGADGAAGELGHLLIDIDGPACGCGARGHLEAYASGTGIARAARERGMAARGAADVAAAEEAGDPVATEVMASARAAFAAGMVSIVDVFNPRLIVVGGGVAMGQAERLLVPARERVAAEAFRRQAASVRIVPAALGDDVGLMGALPLVAERGGFDRPATPLGRPALHAGPPKGDDSDDSLDTDLTTSGSGRSPAALSG